MRHPETPNSIRQVRPSDSLRAVADFIDSGGRPPHHIQIKAGRVQPWVGIHHHDELVILEHFADGPVRLTRDDVGEDPGWKLQATVGPVHWVGFVFAETLPHPDRVAGIEFLDAPARTEAVAS